MASGKQIRVAPPTSQHNIQRRNSPQSMSQVLATRGMDTPVRLCTHTPSQPRPPSAGRSTGSASVASPRHTAPATFPRQLTGLN